MTVSNGIKRGSNAEKANGHRSMANGRRLSSNNKTEEDDANQASQIHELIGHFGNYQFMIYMFKILIGVTSAFNNLGVTFYAPTDYVGFQCSESVSRNQEVGLYNQNLTFNHLNHAHINTLDGSVPGYKSLEDKSSLFVSLNDVLGNYDSQTDLNHDIKKPKNLTKSCEFYDTNQNRMRKCASYQYNKGIWKSTIIEEWNLVCDRRWLVSMTQSLYMSGFIVSFLVFGYISDRFGRWRSLALGALIEVSSGLGCAFANSITTFMVFRFLLGLGNAGRTTSSYLVMIEWCGPKWRMYISTLGSLGWVIGYCSMPWITLQFTAFRQMQLFVCLYETIFIIWLLRLPESPRWLLTHRRFDEAYRVLLMAAKFNGIVKDDKGARTALKITRNEESTAQQNGINHKQAIHYVELGTNEINHKDGLTLNQLQNRSPHRERDLSVEQFEKKFKVLTDSILAKEFSQDEDRLCVLDLFKWKNLRRYTLILSFVWAVDSFIYYGIVLGVGDFGGDNLFLAFTIAGLTELPSIAFTIICMKFLPRKSTNLFIFTTTSLLCILQVPLRYYDIQWLQQWTMMMAKLFNSCSFTCILYQTMELFPTSIRQTAYCALSLAGRIGSILAPFIKTLQQVTRNEVAPIMYAILSALATVMILYLPETKGTDLHDTLMEAEKYEDKNKTED